MENTLSHFTILFSLFFVSACNTKPQGKLLNLDRNKVFREDETNPIGKDLGWTLTATVKNIGWSGEITVLAKISTSDGDYSQVKEVYIEGEGRETLTFEFWEPNLFTEIKSHEVKFLE